ncbi:hypothetical protein [Methylophaga sp.]|uniref:hypothetical protein n=1 Tax=Methylophaga sp. TaxID=2024840 RepID=UPI003A8FF257
MASSLALHRGMVVSIDDPLQQGRVQIQNIASGEQLWAMVNTISLGTMEVKAIYLIGDEVMYLADDSNTDALLMHRQKSATCDAEQQNSSLKIALNTETEITLALEDNSLTLATNFGQQVTFTADGGISISASKISLQASRLSLAASNLTVDTSLADVSGVLKCDTLIANSVVSAKYSPGAGNVN